jgi:hypothetical protein
VTRIAFVATGGFDAGGRERVIPALLWLVERLAREHEIHVSSFVPEPTVFLRGATVHDLAARGTEPPVSRARSALRRGRSM